VHQGKDAEQGLVRVNSDLVFCRADGTGLDGWQVRREFAAITKAAGLGEDWTPWELRHSFVSILSASDVPLEDISVLVGHVSTSVSETVYRQEIRPALTRRSTRPLSNLLGECLPAGSPKIEKEPRRLPEPLLTCTFWSGRRDLNPRPLDPQECIHVILASLLMRFRR
jgi:hypothetical protein